MAYVIIARREDKVTGRPIDLTELRPAHKNKKDALDAAAKLTAEVEWLNTLGDVPYHIYYFVARKTINDEFY